MRSGDYDSPVSWIDVTPSLEVVCRCICNEILPVGPGLWRSYTISPGRCDGKGDRVPVAARGVRRVAGGQGLPVEAAQAEWGFV